MGDIAIYIGTVIAAIIVCEMLISLMPEGNMRKFVKLVIGILLLILIVTPLQNCSVQDLKIPEISDAQNEEKTQNSYQDIILDVYNRSLENNNN